MITSLVDLLFGCWHSNYSFPLTPRRPNSIAAAQLTGTYTTCLDCGKERPYCLDTMRVLPMPRRPYPVAAVPVASKQRP